MKGLLKIGFILIVCGVSYVYSMQKQTTSLLGLLPQDLRNLLISYVTSVKNLDEAAQHVDSLVALKGDDPDKAMQWYIASLANKFKISKGKVAQKFEEKKVPISLAVREWLARNEKLEKGFFDAAWNDDIKNIQRLIEEGVDINARDEYGHGVFGKIAYSVRPANAETVKVLLNLGARPTQEEWKAFVRAATEGHEGDRAAVNEINQRVTMDPNSQDSAGQTVLATIIERATAYQLPHVYDMARMLLELGADPNIQDKKGKSALDYARERSFPQDFIEMLMKAEKSSE